MEEVEAFSRFQVIILWRKFLCNTRLPCLGGRDYCLRKRSFAEEIGSGADMFCHGAGDRDWQGFFSSIEAPWGSRGCCQGPAALSREADEAQAEPAAPPLPWHSKAAPRESGDQGGQTGQSAAVCVGRARSGRAEQSSPPMGTTHLTAVDH